MIQNREIIGFWQIFHILIKDQICEIFKPDFLQQRLFAWIRDKQHQNEAGYISH